MSHVAYIELELKDQNCLELACKRLNLSYEVDGVHNFGNEPRCSGFLVKQPRLYAPFVIKSDGRVAYDSYGHERECEEALGLFKQAYGVEVAKKEIRKKGKRVTETKGTDGQIILRVAI